MAFYLEYNGIDLSDLVGVRSIEMPGLPSMEHSSFEIFERNGNAYNGLSYGNREITISFIVKGTDREEYSDKLHDVMRAFYTKEEAKLYYETNEAYIWCVPTGDITVNEITPTWSECEVKLIAYDPYWYGVESNVVNNEGERSFDIECASDTEVYPTIQVGFTGPGTFCKIENKTTGEKILLGGTPTTEGEIIKKNSKILTDAMESTTGWISTTAPIDSNRSTGGTLAVTGSGQGLMCGDYGSESSGAIWHGCCYKKNLETNVKDFKVRVRMMHNSTGTNGDPTRPYKNDTDKIVTGTRSTYYKVTASKGANFRKKASSSGTKICVIPKGTKLTGTVSKNWLKVTYNGKEGYTYVPYLKKYVVDGTTTQTQCNYVTTKGTAIRTLASKSSKNKKTIPAGTCIRVFTTNKYPADGKEKGKFYFMAKPYKGQQGYVWIDNLIKASDYTVEYEDEPNTADDKTGIVEIYGFSANNVQLFKMGMYDDNEYYEFTYPSIRMNHKDFLEDKTVAPSPKNVTTYDDDSKKIDYILSGKYGDWNEFYGELYIERISNKWYAYVEKIKDGETVKRIKTKTITDKTNKNEELAYLVLYIGTTGSSEKSSDMAVTHIEVKTATEIDNTVTYNFEEFEDGDVLTVDNSIPSVKLNGIDCNDLLDIGSSFFALQPGKNRIKVSSNEKPNADIIWNNKHI